MPRSASSGSSSVVVVPMSTSPARCFVPLAKSIRSVTVVLPASMWAIMPMLRMRSSGVAMLLSAHKKRRGLTTAAACSLLVLPREMRERLVSIRHTVYVFALAHGGAFAVERGNELVGQLLGRRPALLLADRHPKPADGPRLLPRG